MADKQPTLVLLISEDWFFVSHFWARALAAQKAGWRVVVITRHSNVAMPIEASGIDCIHADIERKSLNPLKAALFILRLTSLYQHFKPDIVHHIALKPIILGSLAARLARVPAVVNAPVGLGFVFSSRRFLAKILKPLVKYGLRCALTNDHSLTIFENPDDQSFMIKNRLVVKDKTRLIRGAGVDTTSFSPIAEPLGKIKVLLAARLIHEKGVLDFVKAAGILNGKAEFCIAGSPDNANPNPVKEHELRGWESAGIIRWLGTITNMPALLRDTHIVVLPSTYGEGLPKILLEAMATGRPVVASDIPGCREAVEDGETGLLVPPHSPEKLATTLSLLINDPVLRAQMGAAGRARVMNLFSDDVICQQTLAVYNDLLTPRPDK